MKNIDLYSQVYRKIEEDVLLLSSYVCFNDEMINVYSIFIADLLVRCVIEIESIAKQLYSDYTKNITDKPSVCINWMVDNWEIDKKKVFIVSPHFRFESLKEFCPFDYLNKSPEDYYSAYNAVKHNRANNLNKANLYSLIRSVGALYILNVIYSFKRISLNEDKYGQSVNLGFGSDIFSLQLAPCSSVPLLTSQESIDASSCLVRIYQNDPIYGFRINYFDRFDEQQSFMIINTSDSFQRFAQSYIGKRISEDWLWNEQSNYIVGSSKEDFYNKHNIRNIASIYAAKTKASYYIGLNI